MNQSETNFSRTAQSQRFWQGAICHVWTSKLDKHWRHSQKERLAYKIYQLSFVLDKFRLNGILAGYGKLQVKSPMGQMINEEPYFHLDVVSDFWVFRYVQYVILMSWKICR